MRTDSVQPLYISEMLVPSQGVNIWPCSQTGCRINNMQVFANFLNQSKSAATACFVQWRSRKASELTDSETSRVADELSFTFTSQSLRTMLAYTT